MSKHSDKNYNANKAKEKEKRPPKDNSQRPSKGMSGQKGHGGNRKT